MEALRSLEQGWRLRGVLRHSGIDEFDGASHSDVQLNHRARACVGGRGKRGQEGQALGRSRGGFTTKIHAKSDASGDIIAFDLTGGEASDGRHFETLLDIGPDIQPRAAICDKGYASKANREAARARGIAPVIPHKANEKDKPAFFARTLYKARARIEQGVGRLKRFKRVALRCEKTERNFRSIVSFAAGLCLIKFVHTARRMFATRPRLQLPNESDLRRRLIAGQSATGDPTRGAVLGAGVNSGTEGAKPFRKE